MPLKQRGCRASRQLEIQFRTFQLRDICLLLLFCYVRFYIHYWVKVQGHPRECSEIGGANWRAPATVARIIRIRKVIITSKVIETRVTADMQLGSAHGAFQEVATGQKESCEYRLAINVQAAKYCKSHCAGSHWSR